MFGFEKIINDIASGYKKDNKDESDDKPEHDDDKDDKKHSEKKE